MFDEPNTEYLVVAEIKRKGFLIKKIRHYDAALIFANDVFDLSLSYHFHEMYKVEEELVYFAQYEIKGNNIYCGKSEYTTSNGDFTVTLVKINTKTFCLKTFIKERENSSNVFPDFEDRRLDKLFKLFPNFNMNAN